MTMLSASVKRKCANAFEQDEPAIMISNIQQHLVKCAAESFPRFIKRPLIMADVMKIIIISLRRKISRY